MSKRLLDICTSDAKKYLTYKEFAYPHKDSDLARKYHRQPWGEKPAREILNFLGVSETKGGQWAVGYGYTRGVTADHRFTREVAEHKLKEVVLESIRDASTLVPDFEHQPEEVQSVLAFMVRDLGRVPMTGFRTTLRYCTEKDYRNMALALEKTLWYSNGGRKAKDLVKRIRELAN